MRGSTAAVLLAALVIAPAAIATAPKKGHSYRGTLAAPRNAITITFKVSSTGKKVTRLKTNNLPIYCSGGGPAQPVNFKTATVTSKGTFKSTGKRTISSGALKGQTLATLSITGTFLAGGKERGKLTVKYSKSPDCSGSSKYTTHA
ncbi:MAG: hypothetical protein QOI98_2862 [Solirubrobacteraceae bacterium]|nr:hypothetical protein [Solirubrobacteraceae bacterium]